MKAEEEQCFQSKKTDASLYNGRPTGTGTQCHSVGALSNTLSIPKDKDGVSVEHAHTPTKQWFVLRVSYGRVLKAKAVVYACHIECYASMRQKQITKHGKKHIITEPLISSLIFAHTSQEEVDAMLHDNNVNFLESRSLLSYYYDHTSYRKDNPERNPPLVIQDEAMDWFSYNNSTVKVYKRGCENLFNHTTFINNL